MLWNRISNSSTAFSKYLFCVPVNSLQEYLVLVNAPGFPSFYDNLEVFHILSWVRTWNIDLIKSHLNQQRREIESGSEVKIHKKLFMNILKGNFFLFILWL